MYACTVFYTAVGPYPNLIDEQCVTDMRQRVVVDGEVSIWKSALNGGATRICTTTKAFFNIH